MNYLYFLRRWRAALPTLDPVVLPLELSNISPVSTDWHGRHGTMAWRNVAGCDSSGWWKGIQGL